MSNTQKPPLAVTLNNMGTAIVKPREYYDKHTYVHLGQFMAEVERRAGECAEEGLSFDPAFVDACRDLFNEIKEGKA